LPGGARLRFEGPITGAAVSQTRPASPAQPNLETVKLACAELREGKAACAQVLFAAANSSEPAVRDQARAGLDAICRPVAEALAAPVLRHAATSRTGWADWQESARWWAGHVDDDSVRALARYRQETANNFYQRDALFRIRQIASTIIRADLYLTGPPFPGPR